MIKTRKAGVWQDVTLYKERVAGAWQDVVLGKRYYVEPISSGLGTPRSSHMYNSATASSWEVIDGATLVIPPSLVYSSDPGGAYVPFGGAHASSDITPFSSALFYMEIDILVNEIGSGGLPAVQQIYSSSGAMYNFILIPEFSGYNLAFKDVNSEEVVYSGGSTLDLGTRYVLGIVVDTVAQNVEFYVDGMEATFTSFSSPMNTSTISKQFVGDVDENYGANKFVIYRAEVGVAELAPSGE